MIKSPQNQTLQGSLDLYYLRPKAGFHSIGFPSEWGRASARFIMTGRFTGFHSIGFPSEWGQVNWNKLTKKLLRRFHSIGFPSEWGRSKNTPTNQLAGCFHSIGFPSEWGRLIHGLTDKISGKGFHSIGFPSEWGRDRHLRAVRKSKARPFPFNWFPQRVGTGS